MVGISRRRKDVDREMKRASMKRKRVEEEEEDEEIDSDEAEGLGAPSDGEGNGNVSSDDESLEDENETVEEKRLRLTRDHLRKLGVDDTAELDSDDSGDEADDEDDDINARLRKDALQETRHITTPIALSISGNLASASVTACAGHALSSTCISLAQNSPGTAVSGGKDSRIIVWDLETGTSKNSFKTSDEWKYKRNPSRCKEGHIGNILTVAVSDDGQIAASGGLDGLVRVWDLRCAKLVNSLRGHRDAVQSLAFRNGTRTLYSASSDRTVKVWDLNDMAYVDTLFGHGSGVQGIDCLHREKPVSCGQDGTLRVYKVVEGSQLVFRQRLTSSIDTVSMMNYKRSISGGDDGSIALWYNNSKKPKVTIPKAHGGGTDADSWISSVKAVPFTDLALSGGGDGNLRFWNAQDKPVPSLTTAGQLDIGPGFVNGIDTNEDASIIVAAVGNEHRLGRWSRIKEAKNGIRIVRIGKE